MKQGFENHYRRRFLPSISHRQDLKRCPDSPTTTTTDPSSSDSSCPNFWILLIPDSDLDPAKPSSSSPNDLPSLVSSLNIQPDHATFRNDALCFQEWFFARTTFKSLWEKRLRGESHFRYVPILRANVSLPSDEDDLVKDLTPLFVAHLKEIMSGKEVRVLETRYREKGNEIEKVSGLLRRKNRLVHWAGLVDMRKNLVAEREMISRRVAEFRAAIGCILRHLEGEENGDLDVFCFRGKEVAWERIHRCVLREIRRMEDGLPLYVHRKDILTQIKSSQVTVLIGETGSGKSTQLVQYLADSGVAADGAIVCTQPRKIAAVALAERVRKETTGCYSDKRVILGQSFLSTHQFASNLIFTTDHSLLLHYMNDKLLSSVSCIIIDEAHERSMNTDILLALLKDLLFERPHLRLVIMSATADANQLSDYFFGCRILHVSGRTFPVVLRYVPFEAEETASVPSYVSEVVRVSMEIHKTEQEGTILSFLTSQSEVEWACGKFITPAAVALPLHGKLSSEEQNLVFQTYPGKRKVIFATNIAETSLTIPGVKYVVDCGMSKQSKFESSIGMNVLRVGRISQSSARQRAGRAGRTSPGKCYRLYTASEFDQMAANDEPEIRRVHLGVAVLRILALTSKSLKEFNFIDTPSGVAIDTATRSLLSIGAVSKKEDGYDLTEEGRYLVKLGIEPRLGKLILDCHRHGLGKEGLVLAAVMANSSSIFCRVGSADEKYNADRVKVKFCHTDGDLFTLLSVFKEWEALPDNARSSWCWGNRINSKTMKRCLETVKELDHCLWRELRLISSGIWSWDPVNPSDSDHVLKKVVLSTLIENVAMYSGSDQLGYEVALTGQYVKLHPSCSLQAFAERPTWVVFGEILAVSSEFLVCVTAVDYASLISSSPSFDVVAMESRKMQVHLVTGCSSLLLKRFCGKWNTYLNSVISNLRKTYVDNRITAEVDVDRNEILLFAPAASMSHVVSFVDQLLERERLWMQNECLEKLLFTGTCSSPPVALLGAGAEIKHLELEKKSLSVDVYLSNAENVDEKELLGLFEKHVDGVICSVYRFPSVGDDKKWARLTFLSPEAAEGALCLTGVDEVSSSIMKVELTAASVVNDFKSFPFNGVKASVTWPRRRSIGVAFIRCNLREVNFLIGELCNLVDGGSISRCEMSTKHKDTIVMAGIDKELSESDIMDMIGSVTKRRVDDLFLLRSNFVGDLDITTCQEALFREIAPFMPKNCPFATCNVQLFSPKEKDSFFKASVTFDWRLHHEAANALESLQGKTLPGFLPWQKIHCQRLFQMSITCSRLVFMAVEHPLRHSVLRFNSQSGVECSLERNENGSYRVRIASNATKTIAKIRRHLEDIIKGRTIKNPHLTSGVLQCLFTRSGLDLMNSIQKETSTYILFDRQASCVKIYGDSRAISAAEEKLVHKLLTYHEIHLRGRGFPMDLMKRIVRKFGPDLRGLVTSVPGVEATLNTRRHVIVIRGDKDLKQQVEDLILDVARENMEVSVSGRDENCPICLCPIEDEYRLESCSHSFCQLCLVDQLESVIRNSGGFPVCCLKKNCKTPIWLSDLKSLLTPEKLEELFRASLSAHVASSGGKLRFCPSPDCPSVYQVGSKNGEPFVCGACYAEICTCCHVEYHPFLTCERYREFKEDPDVSLKEWWKGKEEHVKGCSVCGYVIEKRDGCNHVECRCGCHICWSCLEPFDSSDDCYNHLRSVHGSI